MTARRTPIRPAAPTLQRAEDWRTHGRCVGLNHIFDAAVERPNDNAIINAAKAICDDCPVRAICLREMDALCEFGVVGGLDGNQRRAMRRRARKEATA